jgi:hypothetical protein
MDKQQAASGNPQPSMQALADAEEKALAWMGPPPVVGSEDPDKYRRLRSMVAEALQPTDILDWFLVDDVVHSQFEIARLRRVSATFIKQQEHHFGGANEEGTAVSVFMNLNILEQLDRMTATKELRRNRAFQEADRRRDRAAARSTRAPSQIDDVEYRVVEQSQHHSPAST